MTELLKFLENVYRESCSKVGSEIDYPGATANFNLMKMLYYDIVEEFKFQNLIKSEPLLLRLELLSKGGRALIHSA